MADKYNVEGAEILANEALHLPISESVPIYEQLVATFPTSAKYWKQYVEAHMAVNNDDEIKPLFYRCLMKCYHIPLWRCYIRFVRKINDAKGIDGYEETKQAYDYMLDCIGSDVGAGPVWMEYLTFLKSLPAHNTQEETQRMTAVRKVYQKAIITPTHHVEQIWRDYENFENSVSRALAKGLLSEYQPKYNSARAVYRERKKYIEEIDWNMLAVPPSGSYKEELQWMAWKKLLAFERENPQRIDSYSANKRIEFTYKQCLMYLHHYPDIWYDYATWHAKSGFIDSAVAAFEQALEALPDSEMLRYAFAELEEFRGAIQPAKKVYETLIGDGVNATSLSHIQFIRFLRRTEGVEAARKYFLDARKSPSCTYHVYVAYAMMAFCLDKDAKNAHTVFEAGLKRFMHEPGYILEYADFLSRLNDDRNIRALFERALSSLPPEESVEVWKRFTQFEQTYGDLASMLKVEQRRKEALCRTDEEAALALESSLQDVVSRYSFMDLWPCSSKDLDHLARQQWISKNISKKADKSILSTEANLVGSSGLATNLSTTAKVIYPDISRMKVYDPRQNTVLPAVLNTAVQNQNQTQTPNDNLLKAAPPSLVAFIASLPTVEGPSPDVDFILSICVQSNIPAPQGGKPGTALQQSGYTTAAGPGVSDASGSRMQNESSFKPRQPGKRKDHNRQEEDETVSVQSQPMPRDAFKIRQLRKARSAAVSGGAGGPAGSQTGSVSYGSAFSGELSGSTG